MRDKYYYINRLPEIKLSYDNILHKKVYADLFALVPVGIKVLAWFTYDNNNNICLLLHLNKYNNIINVETITVCYDKILSYGTIIYGTYFKHNNQNFISCENIYYFKGENIQEKSFSYKLNILDNIFSNLLQQKAYNKNFVIFGLPYINNNLNNVLSNIKNLPYPIYSIAFIKSNEINISGILLNKHNNNIENIFKIKADIEQDIYTLYCKGNNKDNFYGYAGIFDYKTSVMMNRLFRTIKENSNLDLLEMSDNEDEFENISEDKFVNIKKIVYMKCLFNKKFKKWQPIESVNFKEKLLSKHEIYNLETS
ncbi:hypothetical protein ceV_240 [Chrysochromulina ericina virus CeV-01B]|jgi:hypothetical protein|uniref:Uncharacterized protein n=1 Tax=Chrysochromulina ericina virus CeV-01B TaxID=3070830 RepID=A0A0N9R3Q1_9VIRU|nr:hypothetical protein ceV_240 [Chrysochromulina ericina virus]ALH23146.1 hypothetical protein ceV_240 [Chrysochromulina ericina virus CeV-01B]|tara:strand:- start:10312 stop:11241 length:930 start_codon:yes stop_codon:yes gene_type:complete